MHQLHLLGVPKEQSTLKCYNFDMHEQFMAKTLLRK